MGPDDLFLSLGPSQPQKKRLTFKQSLFGPVLLGGVLGLFASLIESTMKDPFKLMWDLFGLLPWRSRCCGSTCLWSGWA